jgi:Mrp family chromosome partitioning ATPase
VAPAPGLSDILAGDRLGGGGEVIRKVGPRLNVLCAGDFPQRDSQEILASPRMTALLMTVRTRYDLVLLDTPPVLPVADALVLAKQADATLMVVRWEKTDRGAVEDAVRLLRNSRARIMGAIMTQVDPRKAAMAGGRMQHAFGHYESYHLKQVSRG